MHRQMSNTSHLAISVVIATLNRGRDLCQTLKYFLEREDFQSFEVIVIDQSDSIDDETRLFLDQHHRRMTYLHRQQKGLAVSRNFGLSLSTGNIVVFVDDDVEPRPGFLQAHCDAYRHPQVWGATGPVLSPEDPAGESGIDLSSRYGGAQTGDVSEPKAGGLTVLDWLVGCNMSFRRDVLLKLGGFDHRYEIHCDDSDMSHRVKAAGGLLVFHPKAALVHFQNPAGGTRDGRTTPVRSAAYSRTYTRSLVYFSWRIGENPLRPTVCWRLTRRVVLNRTVLKEGRTLRTSVAFMCGFVDAFRCRNRPLLWQAEGCSTTPGAYSMADVDVSQ